MKKTKEEEEGLPSIEEMLSKYKEAWSKSDRSNPYALWIDKYLLDHGCSWTCFDVKTLLSTILAKKVDRTDIENKFVQFCAYVNHSKEQWLVDRVKEVPVGQIFLLKAQCGYKEGSELTITEKKETVMEYGHDQ